MSMRGHPLGKNTLKNITHYGVHSRTESSKKPQLAGQASGERVRGKTLGKCDALEVEVAAEVR